MYSYHCVNVFYSIYHFSQTIKTASFHLQIPGFCLRVLSHVQFWNKQWVWNFQMVSAAPLRTCCIWHWGIIQGKSLFTWSSVVQLMVRCQQKRFIPLFLSSVPYFLMTSANVLLLIGWNRSSWHFWTIDNILTLGPITRSVTVLS